MAICRCGASRCCLLWARQKCPHNSVYTTPTAEVRADVVKKRQGVADHVALRQQQAIGVPREASTSSHKIRQRGQEDRSSADLPTGQHQQRRTSTRSTLAALMGPAALDVQVCALLTDGTFVSLLAAFSGAAAGIGCHWRTAEVHSVSRVAYQHRV